MNLEEGWCDGSHRGFGDDCTDWFEVLCSFKQTLVADRAEVGAGLLPADDTRGEKTNFLETPWVLCGETGTRGRNRHGGSAGNRARPSLSAGTCRCEAGGRFRSPLAPFEGPCRAGSECEPSHQRRGDPVRRPVGVARQTYREGTLIAGGFCRHIDFKVRVNVAAPGMHSRISRLFSRKSRCNTCWRRVCPDPCSTRSGGPVRRS